MWNWASGFAGIIIGLGLYSNALADDVSVQVGQRKLVDVGRAEGVVLDNPSIADVQIFKGYQIEVLGKVVGDGTLMVVAPDGDSRTYAVHVVAGSQAPSPGSEASDAARAAVFGGKKIAGASCAEPVEGKRAALALKQARSLAEQDRIQEAIQQANQGLIDDPQAAVFHLFLGSAWAKLRDQARGAYHFETFALSCPEHPAGKTVAQLLQDFGRRISKETQIP